jgi:2-dehydro-3-deoxyphosphogluconate aldolase / (4S)-4-hydroxy-2-oxoglutarate aldolase
VKPLPDLVVIYRGLTTQEVCAATEALLGAGVTAFETTVDSPDAFGSIAALHARFADHARIGAGTVRTTDDVRSAADAGASFLLSPHVDPDVIAATKRAGLLSVPGAFTASEVLRAHLSGADVVKIFPVGPVGASYVAQLRGPLDDVPMLVSGGITAELGRQCLTAGCASVGVSVELIDAPATRDRDWARLAASTTRYLAALRDRPTGAAHPTRTDTRP